MKKTLIMVLILLLIVTIGYMVFQSLSIGNIQILGVKMLDQENKKLESSIQTLSKLNNTDYVQALTSVSNSAKQYEQAKNEYEELATVSTDSEIAIANQLQKYEIEYLWTRIGNHATSENVVLKLEVRANSTSTATGYYDLSFTVAGDYVSIIDFVYDIENDSSLGFKIEAFKMIPSGNNLQASFICSNIAINIDSSLVATQATSEKNTKNESTKNANETTNTTNTTNSEKSQTTEKNTNTSM